MQTHFSFTTRRAAEIACVEKHVLLTALQRHGHWRGIVPRKLPSGHLRWESSAVYEVCGVLPAARNAQAESWRAAVCGKIDVDPLAAYKVITCLIGMHALKGSAGRGVEALQAHEDCDAVRVAAHRLPLTDSTMFTSGPRGTLGGSK